MKKSVYQYTIKKLNFWELNSQLKIIYSDKFITTDEIEKEYPDYNVTRIDIVYK
jgi:hypothetical protein